MESANFSSAEFEIKLALFQEYVNRVTLRDSECGLEERRKKILGSKYFFSN